MRFKSGLPRANPYDHKALLLNHIGSTRRSRSSRANPYYDKALALDLFPHTEHVEAILLLER